MGRGKKLARTILFILLISVGIFVFRTKSDYEPVKENPILFVQKIHDFYIDSGYDTEDLYVKDRVFLEKHKQIMLDGLSYRDTIKYVAIQNKELSGKIDNDFLNLLDETIYLLNEGLKKVNKQEYIQIEEQIKKKSFKSLLE